MIPTWPRVIFHPNYSPGERLPALIWYYPREYTSQEDYDKSRRTFNKNQFPRIGPRTLDIMTQAGCVVVEPDAPIVGPSGGMHAFYIHDLGNDLSAIIDELDGRALIERSRLGLGGRGYGAP